jgi:RHS repeat-associated protein
VLTVEEMVVQVNHYDPWGQHLLELELPGKPEHLGQFTGQPRLGEGATEWSDFGARYYDARLGRWHAQDPLAQYHSPYLALGNSPVVNVDPDGRWVHIAAGAVIGGIVNLALKWNQAPTLGQKFAAFGIGAAAGAIGAATGSG